MSCIGKARMGRDPVRSFRNMNKNVWTREFKKSYMESVVYYVKPSAKKRESRKIAIRKGQPK